MFAVLNIHAALPPGSRVLRVSGRGNSLRVRVEGSDQELSRSQFLAQNRQRLRQCLVKIDQVLRGSSQWSRALREQLLEAGVDPEVLRALVEPREALQELRMRLDQDQSLVLDNPPAAATKQEAARLAKAEVPADEVDYLTRQFFRYFDRHAAGAATWRGDPRDWYLLAMMRVGEEYVATRLLRREIISERPDVRCWLENGENSFPAKPDFSGAEQPAGVFSLTVFDDNWRLCMALGKLPPGHGWLNAKVKIPEIHVLAKALADATASDQLSGMPPHLGSKPSAREIAKWIETLPATRLLAHLARCWPAVADMEVAGQFVRAQARQPDGNAAATKALFAILCSPAEIAEDFERLLLDSCRQRFSQVLAGGNPSEVAAWLRWYRIGSLGLLDELARWSANSNPAPWLAAIQEAVGILQAGAAVAVVDGGQDMPDLHVARYPTHAQRVTLGRRAAGNSTVAILHGAGSKVDRRLQWNAGRQKWEAYSAAADDVVAGFAREKAGAPWLPSGPQAQVHDYAKQAVLRELQARQTALPERAVATLLAWLHPAGAPAYLQLVERVPELGTVGAATDFQAATWQAVADDPSALFKYLEDFSCRPPSPLTSDALDACAGFLDSFRGSSGKRT